MDRSRTKQVCTIGPASAEKISAMVAAGMDVARINFSHGTPEDHRSYVHAVRAAAHSARRSVAVMVDLPGPKLRLGELEGGEARLEAGAEFVLRAADTVPGNASGAAVTRSSLATQLAIGDRVLLADGAAELHVTAIDGADVRAEVVSGGLIRSRSGVNIPSERMTGEGLTAEDRDAVPRALELRTDLIAQSFVRNADDIQALRGLLPADGPRLVAKIETRSATDNFDAICQAADGIMVARGDLGVDIPFEDVPLVQKDLVRRATTAGRFTVVATQMLESMTSSRRPTRAEASDVANAVLDGADAVMLSAETAIGSFPVEALQAMERICLAVERDDPGPHQARSRAASTDPTAALISGAAQLSGHAGAGAIWCFTRSGRTAELLSLERPDLPIIAFTLSPVVARRLAVRRAVIPVVLPAGGRNGTLIERMENAWRSQRAPAGYDRVVLVTTSPQASGINRLEIHSVSADGRPATTAGQGARERPRPAPRVAQPAVEAEAEATPAEPSTTAPQPEQSAVAGAEAPSMAEPDAEPGAEAEALPAAEPGEPAS